MAKTTVREYVFDPVSKTVTLLNLKEQLKLEQILWVTNVTANVVLYNAIDAALGGVISDNILTLDYNTAAMNSADSLQIYIDSSIAEQTYLTELLENGIAEIVHQLQAIRNDGGMADPAGRVRVAVESGSIAVSSGTITTVTTATNVSNIGGYSAILAQTQMTNAGAQNLRSRITAS